MLNPIGLAWKEGRVTALLHLIAPRPNPVGQRRWATQLLRLPATAPMRGMSSPSCMELPRTRVSPNTSPDSLRFASLGRGQRDQRSGQDKHVRTRDDAESLGDGLERGPGRRPSSALSNNLYHRRFPFSTRCIDHRPVRMSSRVRVWQQRDGMRVD